MSCTLNRLYRNFGRVLHLHRPRWAAVLAVAAYFCAGYVFATQVTPSPTPNFTMDNGVAVSLSQNDSVRLLNAGFAFTYPLTFTASNVILHTCGTQGMRIRLTQGNDVNDRNANPLLAYGIATTAVLDCPNGVFTDVTNDTYAVIYDFGGPISFSANVPIYAQFISNDDAVNGPWGYTGGLIGGGLNYPVSALTFCYNFFCGPGTWGVSTSSPTTYVTAFKFTAAASPPPSEPAVSLDRTEIDFSGQVLGGATLPQSLNVTNSGGASLAIYGLSLTGNDAADFVINGTSCNGVLLAPGGSCFVSLRFAPLALGARYGALTIASNSSVSPHLVGLTGSGLASPPPPSPSIATLAPSSGAAGTAVTIVGENFGALQSINAAFFGSNPAATINSWSDTQIVATAPPNGNMTGPVPLTVRAGGVTSNAVAFTYTTATKIENKCDSSLLTQSLLFYKKTCDLIAILRSPAGFRISSADASTDELFNWLRTGKNENGVWAWVGNLQLGDAVNNFYLGGPWVNKSAVSYLDAIKTAGESAKSVGQPVVEILSIGSNSLALQFALGFVGVLDTIQQGIKVFDAFGTQLVTLDSRFLLSEYMRERCPSLAEPCPNQELTRATARQALMIDLSPLVDKVLCVKKLKCPPTADDISKYLDWLEVQYQGYRLTHFSSAPAEREKIGKGWARAASGR